MLSTLFQLVDSSFRDTCHDLKTRVVTKRHVSLCKEVSVQLSPLASRPFSIAMLNT